MSNSEENKIRQEINEEAAKLINIVMENTNSPIRTVERNGDISSHASYAEYRAALESKMKKEVVINSNQIKSDQLTPKPKPKVIKRSGSGKTKPAPSYSSGLNYKNKKSTLDSFDPYKEGFGLPRSKTDVEIGNCRDCATKLTESRRFYNYGYRNMVNHLICEDCLPQYVQCSSCSCNFKAEELKLNHCPTCLEKAPAKYIKNYSTRVHELLDKQGKDLDEIYFGVELELESKNFALDTLIVKNLTDKFAILKKDATILQGFEIVSAPCTLDIHSKVWDEFFENLPHTVTESAKDDESTCGMHVHVSRVRLSDLQTAKMLLFVHNKHNRAFVEAIAGRPSSYHNDFEKPKTYRDGKQGGRMQADKDRHTALNLNNHETIEFRLFASTKSKRIFLKNIEFCRALVKFTDWGQVSVKDAADHLAFVKYISQPRMRKEHPNLWWFIEKSPKLGQIRKQLGIIPKKSIPKQYRNDEQEKEEKDVRELERLSRIQLKARPPEKRRGGPGYRPVYGLSGEIQVNTGIIFSGDVPDPTSAPLPFEYSNEDIFDEYDTPTN